MWKRVATAAEAVKTDLIIVSPYLVPGAAEMELIRQLRERGVRVRILTNSLASTDMPIVHAGYRRYRVPLLQMGVELYEVRPKLGEPDDRRGPIKSGSSGAFALHAKVFVFDRQRAFVGSMNFDQRSLRINTELGLIIDSPQIARDIAARFDAIAQPANSYQVVLAPASRPRSRSIRWLGADERQGRDARHRAGGRSGQARLDRNAVAAAAGRTCSDRPRRCQRTPSPRCRSDAIRGHRGGRRHPPVAPPST